MNFLQPQIFFKKKICGSENTKYFLQPQKFLIFGFEKSFRFFSTLNSLNFGFRKSQRNFLQHAKNFVFCCPKNSLFSWTSNFYLFKNFLFSIYFDSDFAKINNPMITTKIGPACCFINSIGIYPMFIAYQTKPTTITRILRYTPHLLTLLFFVSLRSGLPIGSLSLSGLFISILSFMLSPYYFISYWLKISLH